MRIPGRIRWHRLAALGLLLLLLWVGGCAVDPGKVYVKDGKRYGVTSSRIWRARWWNYYERAVSYADGAYWDDAIADFRRALQQRDRDQRRARTYGLHFIDYFPHRELGIVYYHLARYPDATRELEASLSGVDTAKAKFYLNKARKAHLEQSQGDRETPKISLGRPLDGLFTKDFTVTVAGHVEDDTYVSAIAINGQRQFIELAASRLPFQQEIELRDGVNTIEIVAVDLTGKSVRQQLRVHLDRQGPLVSLDPVQQAGEHVQLSGLLSDRSQVVRFALAGQPVAIQPGGELEFRQLLPVGPGTTEIPFEAEDLAGNITAGTIELQLPADVPGVKQGRRGESHPTRWAALRPALLVSDLKPSPSPPAYRIAQPADAHPPVIKFTDLATKPTTYYGTIYLEGQVTDASAVTAFTINGESLWRRESQQLFFGHIAALEPGENRFLLEASDKAGNRASKEIIVHREVASVKQVDARLRVSIMPLQQKGTPSTLSDTVYDHLLTALIDQGRFQLIEREQLEAVLREQKLSQAGLVDPKTAAKIGKIAAAEGMLIGTVTEAKGALEVFMRFVDVETSAILAVEDVYGENLDLRAVRTLMAGLALEIRQQFPLLEGLVLQVQGKKVSIDLGKKQLKKHMKLTLFREGEAIKHPVSGKLLGAPTEILGEIKLQAVFDEFSQGVLRRPISSSEIKQLDKVITK